MRIDEVTLDRKGLRTRKCWWLSGCCSREVVLSNNSPIPKYDKLGTRRLTKAEIKAERERRRTVPPEKVIQRYTIEVSEDEARNGKGRKCPFCGRTMGCYVCDGFPTFQGSVVFSDENK